VPDPQIGGDELAQGEHGRVVVVQEAAQELPRLRVRRGRLDVAPPHPFRAALAAQRQERRGLRVVDDDEVVLIAEQLRVASRGLEVRVALRVGQVAIVALEPVVDGLRDAEERLVPRDHVPLDVEAEVGE
jgi:hypothetical protein